MENHGKSYSIYWLCHREKRYTSRFVRSPQVGQSKWLWKKIKWKLLNDEMLTWLSALSMVGLQLFTLGIKFAALSVLLLQLLVSEIEQEPNTKNQPQVEVNSLILDISRSVLVQKTTTHQFFTETHDVLIDRVIIRTCFDAFSCAFQKRTEAKDHTLTSKTTQKKYAKLQAWFLHHLQVLGFLSFLASKKKNAGPNTWVPTKRWSTSRLFKSFRGALKLSLFFLSIKNATNPSPPKSSSYRLYISCSFHHLRFEQNTW